MGVMLSVVVLITVALGIASSLHGPTPPEPTPTPTPTSGHVLMVDCEGKRKALGRFVGEPEISPSFTIWTDDKGAVNKTRGFVIFVPEGRQRGT